MNKTRTIYESCANCANIYNCSGPDYIDGRCNPGFKPKDQNEKKSKVSDKQYNAQ